MIAMRKYCKFLLCVPCLFLAMSPQWASAQERPAGVEGAIAASAPAKLQGMGVRAASQAAFGKINASPLNYAQIALIGIAIITNNNDNDGQPATFTGGSGSNMAAGG
jgi:hypothetical protein